MEDFLVWIFWAVIIVGSMVSSASKAKKRREAESRPVGPEAPSPQVWPNVWPTQEAEPSSPSSLSSPLSPLMPTSHDVMLSRRADLPSDNVTSSGDPGVSSDVIAAGDDPATALRELLGGDFDLRRAVIESEILTPKYRDRY